MEKEKDNWYSSWFNTPFYHILYSERNYDEAGLFMTKLTDHLDLNKDATILDLACGKGRHSVFLGTLGYQVTGVDLSPASIAEAKKQESKNVTFKVHDMCLPLDEKFDAVFNLFTSFGYFDKEEDNLRTIQAIVKELKPGGYGVIDFLNVTYVQNNLVPEEIKVVDGITFNINREIKDGFILKHIKFTVDGVPYTFSEKVRALTVSHFQSYFEACNIELVKIFGDYSLSEFSKEKSKRLILIFK